MLARSQKKQKRTQTPVALSNSSRRSVQNTLCPPAQPPTPATITKNRSKKVKFSFRLAQTHNQSVLREI